MYPSVSESFCSSCTRSRLSANGQIFTCLFNGEGHDIKEFMRKDVTDEEITNRITAIWGGRHTGSGTIAIFFLNKVQS